MFQHAMQITTQMEDRPKPSQLSTLNDSSLCNSCLNFTTWPPVPNQGVGTSLVPRVFPHLCLGFFLACASDVDPNGFYVCGVYVPRIVAFQVRGCESSLTLWLPCVASKCLLMWLLIVVSKWCLALRLPM